MAATCALPSLVSCSPLIDSGCDRRTNEISSRRCAWASKASYKQSVQNSVTGRILERCLAARIGSAASRSASSQSRLMFQTFSKAGVNVKRQRAVVRASAESENETPTEKAPFGYTRKDVIVLGVGVIVAGFALKYGLEAVGVDSLVAGNVIQITFVLGLTVKQQSADQAEQALSNFSSNPLHSVWMASSEGKTEAPQFECRRPSNPENTRFQNFKDHVEDFKNASMEEHKKCLMNTFNKVFSIGSRQPGAQPAPTKGPTASLQQQGPEGVRASTQ